MPDDYECIPPAAAPLIAIVAAMACAASIQSPVRTAALLVSAAVLLLPLQGLASRHRMAVILIILATAVVSAGGAVRRGRDVDALTASLEGTAFVTVVAPIDRQWTSHGRSWTLLVTRFRLAGTAAIKPGTGSPGLGSGDWIDEPLRIVSSSPPPAIGDAREIVARGFLGRSDEGLRFVSVKSDRLITYRGRMASLDPRAMNRRAYSSAERYARRHPESRESVALAAALALGRSEMLSDEVRDAYRRGGTYHFLVFSGLQVAAAGAALALIGRRRGRPRPTDWLLLLLALGIVLFTGMTPPVTRACAGLALFSMSRIARRPTTLDNLLIVTAGAQLLAWPILLADVGFQFTYAGAGAIVLVAQPMIRRWSIRHRASRILISALVAVVAITPLTLFHFHQYSLGGPLLLPLLAPLVVAMLLLSAAALAAIGFLPAAAPPLLTAISLLNRLSLLANNGIHQHLRLSGFAMAPATAWMIAGYGGGVLALALCRPRLRALVMAAGFAMPLVHTAIRARSLAAVSGARLEALDVGQGDSLLLRDGKSAMLIDGGGRSDDWRFGERRLLPLLLDRGIRHLDVVALSHAHPDHCGGLPAVIDEIAVSEVWLSPRGLRGPCAQQILASCQRSAVPIRLILRAEDRAAGSIRLRAMPPRRNYRRSSENNSSVVYLAYLGVTRVLLTGDIEREAEESLLLEEPMLRADVLKVAHHGSRTSTTDAFLDRVRPRVALVSCGFRNSFGHPHAEVIDRMKARRINILRTDTFGCLRLDFRGSSMFAGRQFDTPR